MNHVEEADGEEEEEGEEGEGGGEVKEVVKPTQDHTQLTTTMILIWVTPREDQAANKQDSKNLSSYAVEKAKGLPDIPTQIFQPRKVKTKMLPDRNCKIIKLFSCQAVVMMVIYDMT